VERWDLRLEPALSSSSRVSVAQSIKRQVDELFRKHDASRVTAVAIVLAATLLLAIGCGSSASFASRATSVCTNAQSSLKALSSSSPNGLGAALQLEYHVLAVFTREVAELHSLQAPQNIATQFRAGLTDDQTLVGMLRSMLERPDYLKLALTLPGHPKSHARMAEDLAGEVKGTAGKRQNQLRADQHTRLREITQLISADRTNQR
jgi:hypothetical protein